MLTKKQRENVEKLIVALRSGDYVQGHGTLCRQNTEDEWRYCCLGVAGKVLGIDEQVMRTYRTTTDSGYPVTGGYLITEVAEQFGFDMARQKSLAKLNDVPYDFKYIANEIEHWMNEQ